MNIEEKYSLLKRVGFQVVNTEEVLGLHPITDRTHLSRVVGDDIDLQINYLQQRLINLGGPKLRQACFVLGDGPTGYVGYTFGDIWNGWDVPFFERWEADRLIENLNQQPGTRAWYEEDAYHICLSDGGEVQVYSGQLIEGKYYYNIGAGDWVWSEIELATKRPTILTRATLLKLYKLGVRDFTALNLSGMIISIAALKLAGINFHRADLRWAMLKGINLADAVLSETILSYANLTGASLTGADLRGAWLVKAQFSQANLTGADLRGAWLAGADLRGAKLAGADLSNANLTAACGKEEGVDFRFYGFANLTGAHYDQATRWPAEFDPLAAGAIDVSALYSLGETFS